MKSQEQRIKAGADILRASSVGVNGGAWCENVARMVLEAADAEPKWPNDEMVKTVMDYAYKPRLEPMRAQLRVALITHDPIIQAAIAYRDIQRPNTVFGPSGQRVIDAVNEAGL